MTPLLILLVVAIVGGGSAWALSGSLGSGANTRALTSRERNERTRLEGEVRAYRSLVHRLDKIAYDNRELDPALSVIIIDEIAKFKATEEV